METVPSTFNGSWGITTVVSGGAVNANVTVSDFMITISDKFTGWIPAPEDNVKNGDLSTFDFSTLSSSQLTQLKTILGIS